MIPILYEKTETIYATNGLGRLRDCISCIVTEERNGIYECDFEYPTTGANYDLITLGRIIGVTHDDTGTIQPFDIVSASKPIDGVVTFHAVHISYRLSFQTVTGTSINSLAAAFTLFGNITGTPFSYWTDKTNSGYLASADGIPKSVRSMLGGIEGSVLDAYGGEYEWDRFTVKLWASRGQYRDFAIRYGVNMLDYTEETDASETWSSCIPYWTDGTEVVIGAKQNSGGATITGRDQCIPLDVSDKFEEKPTAAQVEAAARSYMSSNVPYLPTQTINVSFVRLQDMSEYAGFSNLLTCNLCDTIKVIFPDYKTSANFKIVKTVWDVLSDRYDSMELGTLSTTLAEALGITNGLGGGGGTGTESKSWAYCNNVTSTTITATGTDKKIPITALHSGSGFSYDSTEKGIKCNKGGQYMISCSLSANPATSPDLMGVSIYKNGVSSVGPEYKRMGGNYDIVILSPTPITLAEDDVLTLYGRNNSSARGAFTACRFSLWEV